MAAIAQQLSPSHLRDLRESDEAESSAQAAARSSLPLGVEGNREESRIGDDIERDDEDEDEGEDEEDSMDRYAHVEQLATGRAKRSTAGNRMRALLDQEEVMEDDEMFVEVEGDVDFKEKEDEQDVVDSDFDQDSGDENMEYNEEEEGERELEAQEKAQRKQRVARARTGPAQLKKFGIRQPTARPPPSALKSTVADNNASDPSGRSARSTAQRATIVSPARAPGIGGAGRVRTSSRKATVKVKLETQSKLRRAAERRAAQPTRYLAKKRPRLTQDALIAEALEMEEANRESLRVFLAQEEEKKRARSGTKATIVGPFLRWQSTRHSDHLTQLVQVEQDRKTDNAKSSMPADTAITGAVTEDPAIAARAEAERLRRLQAAANSDVVAGQPSAGYPEATDRTYVSLHDLPHGSSWSEELAYLFGDHTNWVDLRIVPSRNRPLRPRRSTCAITGLAANYRDPRTGVPFANKEAYAVLTDLLEHRFVWGRSLDNNSASSDSLDLGVADLDGKGLSTSGESPQIVASASTSGFYAGREDDPGAGGALHRANKQLETSNRFRKTKPLSTSSRSGASTTASSLAVSGAPPSTASAPSVAAATAPIIVPGVAPGDEKVLMEAALALPSGTTRSGAKRTSNLSSS